MQRSFSRSSPTPPHPLSVHQASESIMVTSQMSLHLTQEPFTQNLLFLRLEERSREARAPCPHLLSCQVGQSFTGRNLLLFFQKRSLFRKQTVYGNSFQRRSEKPGRLLTQLYPLINFLSSNLGIPELSSLYICFILPFTKDPRGIWQTHETPICGEPRSSPFTPLFNKHLLSTHHVLDAVLGTRSTVVKQIRSLTQRNSIQRTALPSRRE